MFEKDSGVEAVNILQSCGGTFFLRIAFFTYHEDLKLPSEKFDEFISSREIGNFKFDVRYHH